jgi:hypothetical protein
MERHNAILQTIPESKYYYLVEEIINDQKNNGGHEMYKEYNKTSYDIAIAKIKKRLNILNTNMQENRKVMDKVITDIENSKKTPGEENYKKATAKEIDEWQKNILILQENYVNYKSAVNTIISILEDLQFNQYIQAGQQRTMRFLRDKYITEGDKNYLEKGVTWAYKYAEKHRLNIDLKKYSIYYT